MTVEQDIADLQKQINELKGKTDSPFTTAVTTNPFSRLGERKIEQGSTGSARIRRIPLHPMGDNPNGAASVVDRGNWDEMTNYIFPDFVDAVVTYDGVIVPSDLIEGGFPTIHYNASTDGTTGDVKWTVRVVAIDLASSATAETSLLLDSNTNITVPAVANTIVERKISLTLPPLQNTSLFASIRRVGDDDSNSDFTHVWNAWIEYLAHS